MFYYFIFQTILAYNRDALMDRPYIRRGTLPNLCHANLQIVIAYYIIKFKRKNIFDALSRAFCKMSFHNEIVYKSIEIKYINTQNLLKKLLALLSTLPFFQTSRRVTPSYIVTYIYIFI